VVTSRKADLDPSLRRDDDDI